MGKSILFIIPPYFNFSSLHSDRLDSIPVFTLPYGILSIVTFLKEFATVDLDVEVLDLNLEAFNILNKAESDDVLGSVDALLNKTVSQKLAEKSFDIVGISALFNNSYKYLESLSAVIKAVESPPLCLVGGGLASNLHQDILKKIPNIDAACLAEGETPMLDLINAENTQAALAEHKSWITLDKIQQGLSFFPSYISDLDIIPILDYGSIDLQHYNGRSVDKRYAGQEDKQEFSIHTSRGCPYSCVYCSNTSIHGKKVRYMSVSRVMAEIDFMMEKHGLNVLLIEDDHFLADTGRAKEVLNAIAQRKIRVEFPNGISVGGIDEELARALKNAGVSAVNLAVESGSDFVLNKLIKKPHLVKHIKPAVQLLKDQDIRVHAFIVLGLPGELAEHRLETMKMIEDVGFDWVYFFLAVPIVGSRLYDICIDNDYLVEKDFSYHLISNATIKAPGVDPDAISEEMYRMNLWANFVNNWNIENRNYETALPYFESMVKKYPSHVLAYQALIRVYKGLAFDQQDIDLLGKKYRDLLAESEEWRNHLAHFNLT